jgi:hypothetical protein
MADIYVNGLAPNGGTGAISSPFNDLVELDAFLTGSLSNHTVHLANRIRSRGLDVNTLTNVTFQPWAGMPSPDIRLAFLISGFGTAGSGATLTYTFDLTTIPDFSIVGTDVASVVEDWDESILPGSDDAHFGHLIEQANLTALQGYTGGLGAWVVVGNILHIRASGTPGGVGDDPATHVIQVCIKNDAIAGSGWTNCHVRNLKICLSPDRTSGFGYGIRLQSALSCSIVGNKCRDNGYHNIGCVGATNQGNTIASNNCGGHRSGNNSIVHYADNDVRSATAPENTIHLYPLLGTDGLPLTGTGGGNEATGIFHHTNGSVGGSTGVVFSKIRTIPYANCIGIAAGFPSNAAVPSDPADLDTYPLVVRDSHLAGSSISLSNQTTPTQINSAAFDRCLIDLQHFASMPPSTAAGLNMPHDQHHTHIRSSILIINLDGVANTRLFHRRSTSRLYLTNCLLIVLGLGTNNRNIFRNQVVGDTTALYFLDRTIVVGQAGFGAGLRRVFNNDGTTDAAAIATKTITNCLFFTFTDGEFSDYNSIDTFAEFVALAQFNTNLNAAPDFTEPAWNIDPAVLGRSDPALVFSSRLSSIIRTQPRLPLRTFRDYYSRPDRGYIGPIQYPPIISRYPHRMRSAVI